MSVLHESHSPWIIGLVMACFSLGDNRNKKGVLPLELRPISIFLQFPPLIAQTKREQAENWRILQHSKEDSPAPPQCAYKGEETASPRKPTPLPWVGCLQKVTCHFCQWHFYHLMEDQWMLDFCLSSCLTRKGVKGETSCLPCPWGHKGIKRTLYLRAKEK